MKIYICHQGIHIHHVGVLAECQACENKLPELTLEEVLISDVDDFAAFCWGAGYDRGLQADRDNH